MAEYSKEQLMNEIQKEGFAAVDLQLYLDTHPTDKKALAQFNQHASQFKSLKETYAKMFAPIEQLAPTDKYPYAWILPPWPWMRLNMMEEEED